MPGILPMKVIKVGTSSASRIAQACDRCRSKKIRCDGIRPCCSQCANVGFECRTSDKLSRRAFPRGYTESLEERVRQLESEVRELKDLLDEKDEKIDMLAKMHNNQRQASVARSPSVASPATSPTSDHKSPSLSASSASSAPSASPPPKKESRKESPTPKEDTFRVQASPLVLGVENSDSYFMGASSGRSFIDIFKRKMQESGKSCSDFHSEAFLHIQGCYPLADTAQVSASATRAPPRLFSDRCVNVYFQEWSPLFPVLHRPAFLRVYDEFVSDADKVKSNHKLAQLYLVFAIAGLSSDQPDLELVAACEHQWQRALDAVLMDNTIVTLQCLVLAILYCAMRADYKRLQYYKGVAIGLSHRLGLHQSQKRFSFGALTIETRKKVFWTLYTLDCFSAAVLGLPKQLKDADIHAEYPADTDDEYVTEKGFQPTLPGESTRLSAALALFRVARILAKVLETNYPAAATHELSLQQMAALDAELAAWRDALPPHLTLTFRQEKPSTDVTGNRSPLLSLVYSYTRTLVWRPAVGSTLGPKAGPAVMAISDASKCIVQIVELLEERNMAFSMCINKADLLVMCGMTLLYHTMDLKPDSKMMKDAERLVNSVLKMAERSKAPGLYDLTRIAALLVTVDDMPSLIPTPSSELSMAAPARRLSSSSTNTQTKKFALGRHNSASMSESDLLVQQDRLRRMTMPATGTADSPEVRTRDRSSFDSPREHIQLPKQHRLSMSQMSHSQMSQMAQMSQMSQMSQMAQMAQLSGMNMAQMPQMVSRMTSSQQQQQQQRLMHKKKSNLDYLNMSQSPQATPSSPQPQSQSQTTQTQTQTNPRSSQPYYTATTQSQKASSPSAVTPADWEALLSSMDGGHMNVYDAIYGGPNIGLSSGTDATPPSAGAASHSDGWSPEAWELGAFTLSDIAGAGKGGEFGDKFGDQEPGSVPAPAQSVLSFSDESMGSVAGDELNAADLVKLGLGGLDINGLPYRSTGLLNAACSTGPESFAVDSLENNFVL